MANISIIGGLGTIGKMITGPLSQKHNVTIIDIAADNRNGIKADASDPEELCAAIPDNTNVIINLISIPTTDDLIPVQRFDENANAFLKTTYVIYHCAVMKQLKKVIFASSNHVTDYYETGGDSTLGREINVSDYPYSKGLYGILKLAGENIGHAFSKQYGLDVINLRIGTARLNEKQEILVDVNRYKKTWLSEADVVQIFEKAIEKDIKYGTYYAVSDNVGKPWDISNLECDLGFRSLINASDILRDAEDD